MNAITKPSRMIVSGRAWRTIRVVPASGRSASVPAPAEPIFDWAYAVARAATHIDAPAGNVLMTYRIPTRGLLGFHYQFLSATRGLGTMTTLFYEYGPMAGTMSPRSRGSLVAWEPGVTSTFGLKNAEERGSLFLVRRDEAEVFKLRKPEARVANNHFPG